MAEYPIWSTAPTPRCFAATGNPSRPICGALARWRSLCLSSAGPVCRCDDHRLATDEPIAGEQLQRRVRVSLVVDLAAAASVPGEARVEAVEQLRRGIEAVGGVMNLLDASAEVGLARFPPAADAILVGKGRG